MEVVGQPTRQERITLTVGIRVITNVRDDYLKRLIGDWLSDQCQDFLRGWNTAADKDDPKRYVVWNGMIGPIVTNQQEHWDKDEGLDDEVRGEILYLEGLTNARRNHPAYSRTEYEQEDDPNMGESTHWDEPERSRREPREPRWPT